MTNMQSQMTSHYKVKSGHSRSNMISSNGNDENPSDKKSILRNKSQFCCGYLKGREIEILYKYFLISRRFGVITSYARKLGLATTACELKVAIRDPRTRADRS